jgi:hypothetical protein
LIRTNLREKEDEVVKEFKSLNSQQEVYLPILTEEKKEQLKESHYVISRQWIPDKSWSC